MFISGITGDPVEENSWDSLGKLFNLPDPFLEKTLFLQGYEFSSNIYVITGDYLSIIDPGNDYTAFMELFSLGYKVTDIKKIVLTHGHQDHVMGSFELFRGYPGIKERDLEVILHEAGPRGFKDLAKELGCRLTEVRGGEVLNLSGFDLEVIHTPGHTLDGLSFYHGPSGTLFTGDTVLPHAMAEMDQEGGGRLDHYLYTLRTLRKKEVAHVLPGHGGLVPQVGGKIIEDTYMGLIMKVVGPETPWMEGATTLAQRGLLEEALVYSNKELATHPDNFRALEMKAFLLLDLGRNAEAGEFFDRVLAQQGDHVYALMGKGRALMGLGQHEDSLKYFDAALKIQPQMKEAQVNKGLALYLAGRPEEAMEIQAFREEFVGRFKEVLSKQSQSGKAAAPPDLP